MADILKTVSNPLGTLVFRETAANATIVANVFNKTAPQMFVVKLDNSANSTEAVYLKLYESTNADGGQISVGTTVPSFVLKAPASRSVCYEQLRTLGSDGYSGHGWYDGANGHGLCHTDWYLISWRHTMTF